MKKTILLLMLLVSAWFFSQVGIGIAQPHQSAMLDVTPPQKTCYRQGSQQPREMLLPLLLKVL